MVNKRERELARAKYERQQLRQAQKSQRERYLKVFVVLGIGLLAILGVALGKNGTASQDATPSAKPSINETNPVNGCATVGPIRPDTLKFQAVPDSATAGDSLTLQSNCGDINIALLKDAPKTTTAMSFLARQSYFNQTDCHRLTTEGIFVLQCGDPTSTGTGGPGFTFKDENLPTAAANSYTIYKRGTVAMANSGPNTNGSQFFLVYKDSPLPPNYSVWGTITSGLDILDRIAGAGVVGGSTDGQPNQRVAISKAIVTP